MAASGKNMNEGGVKRRLADALVELTGEKALSSISITELCEKAGVSRMAFYRNFDSKEDVLISRLDELVERYRELVEPLLAAGERWHGIGHMTVCLAFFREHAALVESLRRCGAWDVMVDRVAAYVLDCWGDGTRESTYLFTAFAGALCSVYRPWAEAGFPEEPQQVARVLQKLFSSTVDRKGLAV